MAHFEAAGYGILSYQCDPARNPKKANEEKEEDGDTEQHHSHDDDDDDDDDDLPSLESLETSLDETEAHQQQPSDDAETESCSSSSATPPAAEFHGFRDLPAELRIKIWSLSFLPRVVELRPTRPNYAFGRTDHRRTQWESGCTNPAALSVSSEARELALAHFRVGLPLARLTPAPPTGDEGGDQDEEWRELFTGAAAAHWGRWTFTTSGKARLLQRVLYVSPEHDTVVTLGLDSDLVRLKSMLDTFREGDPLGVGIWRLGLSVRDWGYGGSVFMLKELEKSHFKHLDQLILFMYSEFRPPDRFATKGASPDQESLEAFRKTGNICELVPWKGSSAEQAYRMWSGTRGRQFWDDDGDIIKIGRSGNDLKIMDLEFKDGW